MNLDKMLAETATLAGVTVAEVKQWRQADWQRHLDRLEAQHTAMTAACDQADALVADAQRCGCRTIAAEVDADGGPVLSTGRIVHTCGRRG
jgi:hypothetical protein